MLTATTLPLAAVAVLASSASAHYYPPSSSHGHVAARSFHHHSNRAFFPARPALNSLHKKRSARTRRGEPESLMPGTLTSSEGCTQYAHVESGDWCIKVVDAIDGMTLDKFYEMNPQIDADCQNLWAGYDVCVSNTAAKVDSTAKVSTSDAPRTTATVEKKPAAPQTTTSSKAPESTTTSFAKVPPVKVAAVKTSSSTTTTDAPKPTTTTTTSAAPAQTSAAAAAQEESEGDSEDDDWVCDDEEESSSSSSAAPAATSAAVQLNQKPQQQEQQQEWTSAAPTTTITSQWVAPTTTTTTSQAPAVTKVADTSSANVLAASGIKNFLGVNSNAILSWYNTNSGQDSTNGRGWCEFNYNNAMPGFAPSLKTMLANFNGDSVAAKKAYCGLEAKITSADGKSITAYIIDAFDDTWVRTPSSLDLTVDTFTSIFGRWTDNKNDVLQQASWEFTGKRRDDFVYRSSQYQ